MAKRDREDAYQLEVANPGVFESRQGPFPPWCVGSVFSPPQLITSELSPLIFNQVGKPECIVSTGLDVEIQKAAAMKTREQTKSFLLSRSAPFIPCGLLEDHLEEDAADKKGDGNHRKQHHGNRLASAKCSDGNIIIFYPCGKTGEKIGSSLCYPRGDGAWYPVKKSSITAANFDDSDEAQSSVSPSFRQAILQLSAVMVQTDVADGYGHVYVAARTSYQVHFCIVLREVERIRFLSTYAATFPSHVSHITWNTHVDRQAAVLLESGEVSLFDVPVWRTDHANRTMDLKAKFTLENPSHHLRAQSRHLALESIGALAIEVFEEGGEQGSQKDYMDPLEHQDMIWWRCEFAWHPQIMLLSGSRKVVQMDFRGKHLYESSIQGAGYTSLQNQKCSYDMTVIAEVGNVQAPSKFCYVKPSEEHILAFARAEYDGMCKFSVATEKHVMLFDTRRVGIPVLQWEHGMTEEPPGLLIMLPASALHASVDGVKPRIYKNGRVIVAVSYQSGDIRMFFYGSKVSPIFSMRKNHSTVKDFEGYDWDDVTYAWEIPLKLYPPKALANDWNNLLTSSDLKCSKNARSSLESNGGLECISGIIFLSYHSSERTSSYSKRAFTMLQLTGSGNILLQQYKASDQSTIRPKFRLDSLYRAADKEKAWEEQKPKFYVLGAFLKYMYSGCTLVCSHSEKEKSSDYVEGGTSFNVISNLNQETRKSDSTKVIESPGLEMEKYMTDNDFRSHLKTVLQHLSVPLSMYEVAHTALRMGLPARFSPSAAGMPSDLEAGKYWGYRLRSFIPIMHSGSHFDKAGRIIKRDGSRSIPLSPLLEVQQLRKLERSNGVLQICGNGFVDVSEELDHAKVTNVENSNQFSTDKKIVPGHKLLTEACSHVENDLKELEEKQVPSVVSLSDHSEEWKDSELDSQPLRYEISMDIFSKPDSVVSPVDKEPDQINISDSQEVPHKELGSSFSQERLCKFVAGKCPRSQGTDKGKRFVGMDSQMCPIKLSFTNIDGEEPVEEELEEQEWTALESLEAQLSDWQQSFKPYSDSYQ